MGRDATVPLTGGDGSVDANHHRRIGEHRFIEESPAGERSYT